MTLFMIILEMEYPKTVFLASVHSTSLLAAIDMARQMAVRKHFGTQPPAWRVRLTIEGPQAEVHFQD